MTQLRAQAGQLFVHPLARARFAVDAQTTRPDPQNIPAAVLQIDSRDEEIRSSQHRIDVTVNIIDNHPDLAELMKALLADRVREAGDAPARPSQQPKYSEEEIENLRSLGYIR